MRFNKLEPKVIWQYFDEICNIPRLSKSEEHIRQYLLDFAVKQGLQAKTDSAGNVLIIKNASTGFENRKSVLLQSHMDMVGEKDAKTPHNWSEDPIEAYVDGNWVKAKDTTLGADDGIGIAAQLAILSDENLSLGPVECLFTVDEESGMTGAKELEKDFFESNTLINLDSEDEGELFIGCAGGIDTIAELPFRYEKVDRDKISLKISVTGLQGGHSGDEIHKGFANSIKLMIGLLEELADRYDIRISTFKGGNLRNAIPREAFASIVAEEKDREGIGSIISDYLSSTKESFSTTESGINITITEEEEIQQVMDQDSQHNLLLALKECPHGVIAWSKEMEGLVETSTNLASVEFKSDFIRIVTSQRSSVEKSKEEIASRINRIFTKNHAKAYHTDGYPGWEPNTNSEILSITAKSYKKLFNQDPIVRAIHAGLECGLILEKYPGLDMISFGPTILGAHTPQERLDIETTVKFWDLLIDVLKNIPEN